MIRMWLRRLPRPMRARPKWPSTMTVRLMRQRKISPSLFQKVRSRPKTMTNRSSSESPKVPKSNYKFLNECRQSMLAADTLKIQNNISQKNIEQ